MLLYYIRVLEENGEFSDALTQLDIYAKERSVVDRTAIAESRGMLLLGSLNFTCMYSGALYLTISTSTFTVEIVPNRGCFTCVAFAHRPKPGVV